MFSSSAFSLTTKPVQQFLEIHIFQEPSSLLVPGLLRPGRAAPAIQTPFPAASPSPGNTSHSRVILL